MKPKPIFIKIRSARGFPAGHRHPNILGTWRPKERAIYLRRGTWNPKVLEHELGHAMLDHSGTPTDPRALIKEELEAEFFGHLPTRNRSFLVGLINSVVRGYDQTPMKAWTLVYEALRRRKDTPKHWFVQMRQIKREIEGKK